MNTDLLSRIVLTIVFCIALYLFQLRQSKLMSAIVAGDNILATCFLVFVGIPVAIAVFFIPGMVILNVTTGAANFSNIPRLLAVQGNQLPHAFVISVVFWLVLYLASKVLSR